MAFQRKDSDLPGLAARAERARSEGDPEGFMSGKIFYSDFAIILGGCIDFDPALPEAEQKRILRRVARHESLSKKITANGILQVCSRYEHEFLKRTPVPHRLLTEISICHTLSVPRIKVGQVTVTFLPKLAKGFAQRAELAGKSKGILGHDLPSGYMQVSTYVLARSAPEAAERSLDAVDLVRASWNLALNRSKSWRHSSGRPTPVNEIRLSPFHTIHVANGALATEAFWFDPGYSRPALLFTDKGKFNKLLAFAEKLRVHLAHHAYRVDLERALVRYVRALDSADLNDAFLRLWSLLEHLTDSTHDGYKVATRRAAFIFSDRELSNLILSNLTVHRNRFVHVGSETEDIESLVFQLKKYVDELLVFHIVNRFGFISRADAAQFMGHSPDVGKLELQAKRIRQALKYRRG